MDESQHQNMGKLLGAVGGLAVTWSILEYAVDICIDALYNKWGADKLVAEIPRTAMNKKIEFLRTVFAEGSPMTKVFDGVSMPEVVDRLEWLAERRHQVIHGVAMRMTGGEGMTDFQRLVRKRSKLYTVTYQATPEKLHELREQMVMSAKLLVSMCRVLAEFDSDVLDELPGEGAV